MADRTPADALARARWDHELDPDHPWYVAWDDVPPRLRQEQVETGRPHHDRPHPHRHRPAHHRRMRPATHRARHLPARTLHRAGHAMIAPYGDPARTEVEDHQGLAEASYYTARSALAHEKHRLWSEGWR